MILRLKKAMPTSRNRIGWIVFFVTVIIFTGVVLISPVFAEDGGTMGNMFLRALASFFLMLAQICIAGTIWALRFFISLASYNGYIDVGIVKVGWVMVRDVANMFFVVAFLVIAFATILGIEQYEWKKGLIKLVIAAIFINFSNVIAQLFIDAAHVFTITFLNAISATAGGNLVGMFNLEKISQITGAKMGGDITSEVLGGAFMAFVLGFMSFVAMGAYVVIMALRVVLLWALIIMSPLAYIFQVLPKTQNYAQEWWKEFSEQVIVAPIMVLFVWLSFATLGGGNIISEMEQVGMEKLDTAEVESNKASLSINKASSWENLANFFIAITFMYIGIKKTSESGAYGGKIITSAVSWGKKVGTIASGYALGRWMVGKGTDLASKGAIGGLKGVAMHFPVIGGENIKWAAKTMGQAVKGEYYGRGVSLTETGEEYREELGELQETKAVASSTDRMTALSKEIEDTGKVRDSLVSQRDEAQQAGNVEKTDSLNKSIANLDKDIQKKENIRQRATEMRGDEGAMSKLDEQIADKEKQIKGEFSGGILGLMSRRSIQRQKRYGKTEKQAEVRRDLLWKRVGSEAGGYGWGMGTAFDKLSRGNKEAQDRIERGWLAGEKMRSDAKDQEYETLGKLQVLKMPRIKFDVKGHHWIPRLITKGARRLETDKGTMAERVEEHKMMAELHGATIQKLEGEAKMRLSLGGTKLKREYDTIGKEMSGVSGAGKDQFTFSYADLAREKAIADMTNKTATGVEERKVVKAREKLIEEYEGAEKVGGKEVGEETVYGKYLREKVAGEVVKGAEEGMEKRLGASERQRLAGEAREAEGETDFSRFIKEQIAAEIEEGAREGVEKGMSSAERQRRIREHEAEPDADTAFGRFVRARSESELAKGTEEGMEKEMLSRQRQRFIKEYEEAGDGKDDTMYGKFLRRRTLSEVVKGTEEKKEDKELAAEKIRLVREYEDAEDGTPTVYGDFMVQRVLAEFKKNALQSSEEEIFKKQTVEKREEATEAMESEEIKEEEKAIDDANKELDNIHADSDEIREALAEIKKAKEERGELKKQMEDATQAVKKEQEDLKRYAQLLGSVGSIASMKENAEFTRERAMEGLDLPGLQDVKNEVNDVDP
ncbi:MAG: hypothetical protein ABIC57_00020, partial [bacterium]